MVGNNGKTGLDYRDSERLGTSNQNIEFMDGGGIAIFGGGGGDLDSWGGRYYGEVFQLLLIRALITTPNGTVTNNLSMRNYRLGSLRVEGAKNTLEQNNLPTGLINSNSDQNTNNYQIRQNFDAIYQIN